jgi:competence ComEA-like helix-hairpin-helix protein
MRLIGLLILAALLPAVAFAAQVNINTADASLLDTLPGIGPTKAAAIIDYRTAHGPFAAIADIQNVKGIGPATFATLEPLITVQPSADVPSYEKVQAVAPPAPKKVEPVTSAVSNIQAHEEAVLAPAEATELAAAGAALPSVPASRTAGLFSVWTLGLLGVIVVAGGVFILI